MAAQMILPGSALLLAAVVIAISSFAHAQAPRRGRPPSVATELPHAGAAPTRRQQPGATEQVEADISARNVPVTASFDGVEIVVFGAVDNSRQPSAESGYYDVIVVIEGVPGRIVARRKSNIAGLWVNDAAVTFDNVPTFYAVASTRPPEEIASEDFRTLYRIGVRHLRFTPAFAQADALSTHDLDEFREAVVRQKEKAHLFVRSAFNVRFSGSSLFSARIVLPANVTVGPFETRVYLFHEQRLLSEYSARLYLEREGLARYVHALAFGYPLLYGLMTVALAVAAGLISSSWFGRGSL